MRRVVNFTFLFLAVIAVIAGMVMKYGKQTQLEASHSNKMVIDSPIQSTPVSDFAVDFSQPNN